MAGYLNILWRFTLLLAIYYYNPIKSTSTTLVNRNQKNRNITKECILLDDKKFVRESIKRNTFLYKLSIYGSEVRFTDIPHDNYCTGSIVIIQIFATDKIIINKNYNSQGRDITLIVAAPILEVNGSTTKRIILKGKDGENHTTHAEDGDTTGIRDGANGKAGFPGGPGGHFHGIALNIINQDKLRINVKGGMGGAGQSGGNGARGKNAVAMNYPSLKILFEGKIQPNGDINGFETILRRTIKPSENETYLGIGIEQVVLGERGTNGGNGGNGGPEGKEGPPGICSLWDLQTPCELKSNFSEVKSDTEYLPSHFGRGGLGGPSGMSEMDVIVQLYFPVGKDVKIIIKGYILHDGLSDGKPGLSGFSFEKEESFNEHPHWQTFSTTASLFAQFLQTNSVDSLNHSNADDNLTKVIELIKNNSKCSSGF